MRELSKGQDLLLTARDELLKQLLPALPPSLRYQALMIANAMAIAAREAAIGAEHEQAESISLHSLLNMSAIDSQRGQSALNGRKQLCAQIRAGAFDPASAPHQELLRHLASTVRAKVAISNPKLLEEISQ
ncbi:hypothetical protein BH11PSE11_BH11PSE11_22080 [soil metagenome]